MSRMDTDDGATEFNDDLTIDLSRRTRERA
jgi:hypothetical protein